MLQDSYRTSSPAPDYIARTDSVFLVARERFAAGTLEPYASILAGEQTAGKGQYGRAWQSHAGNIHAAVRLPLTGVWRTTASAGALSAIIADELSRAGYDVRLKWPNDIVVVKAGVPMKAGGVLLEETDGLLVAGIGLNLAWAPETGTLREGAALPPGRLADADRSDAFDAPRETDPMKLWTRVARRISVEDPDDLAETWQMIAAERLLWKGDTVVITEPEGPGSPDLTGRLLGLSAEGEVVLETHARTASCSRGSLARASL
ncbi:biotin--[acetyl-CoA-carboxylase] ligase [Sutterella sp.]|uniref:biotin--[acetyl-CoA-carboxylase] ligase n=1 Tax=Sutterella sp. TaxID=1981025 RepID=UPI0026DF891E|nr:hypothetical protein [Sutterella sp.]MDO5531541.1 hypothetical protein [Sutterella sp.]